MKIMFLIPALNAGGAERVLVTIANRLSKIYDVNIITLNSINSFYDVSPDVYIKGLNISISSNKFIRAITIPIKELQRLIALKKTINKTKPDVIVSFLFTTNILSLILRIHNKIPTIISERNDPLHYPMWKRQLIKYVYGYADTIVVQGKKVSGFFTKYQNKVIISNPINEEAINLKIPSQREKKIVTVGRLISQKNHQLLIRTFKKINEEFPEYQLDIYGEGHLESNLKKITKELNLDNQINFKGNHNNIFRRNNAYELFVLSSNFEGFPNVLLEAMASGLPVVSTDFSSGIARELITDSKNGFVVPVNDKIELYKSIKKVIESKDAIDVMSKNNRKIFDSYNIDTIEAEWIELFNQVSSKGV